MSTLTALCLVTNMAMIVVIIVAHNMHQRQRPKPRTFHITRTDEYGRTHTTLALGSELAQHIAAKQGHTA